MEYATLWAIADAIDEDDKPSLDLVEGPKGRPGKKGRSVNYDVVQSYIEESISGLDISLSKFTNEEIQSLKLKFSDLSKKDKEDLSLKFESLTSENLDDIRGPRGHKGKEGRAGQGFDFSQNEKEIIAIITGYITQNKRDFSLGYSDLSDNQKNELRGDKGLPGKRGKKGKDFDFDGAKEDISLILGAHIDSRKEEFKLKFEDLSLDNLEDIRGHRGAKGRDGRDGSDGQDFDFEESKDVIRNIIQAYVDKKKEDYKLSFSDLSEDEKESLRGMRGYKGQKGRKGADGTDGLSAFDIWINNGHEGEVENFLKDLQGERGFPGSPGVVGRTGTNGLNGRDGIDGLNAPAIIDIETKESGKNSFFFRFHFDNGGIIDTDSITLPKAKAIIQNLMGGGSFGYPDYFMDIGGGEVGDLVYVSSDDTVSIYDNLSEEHRAVGLLRNDVAEGTKVQVVSRDRVLLNVLAGATAGLPVYWDGSALIQSIPNVSGTFVWRVGVAANSNDLHVNIEYVKKNQG